MHLELTERLHLFGGAQLLRHRALALLGDPPRPVAVRLDQSDADTLLDELAEESRRGGFRDLALAADATQLLDRFDHVVHAHDVGLGEQSAVGVDGKLAAELDPTYFSDLFRKHIGIRPME